jgi:hypothetical protein
VVLNGVAVGDCADEDEHEVGNAAPLLAEPKRRPQRRPLDGAGVRRSEGTALRARAGGAGAGGGGGGQRRRQ